MKKLIIVFLSALLLTSCSEEKTAKGEDLERDLPPHSLTIKAVEFKKTDSTNTLLLESTLWNNTKDTLKYLSMSCSWYDVYSFNNSKVNIKGEPCTRNVPVVIPVDPETNAKTFFKVNLDGITQGSKEKVKLGLKLITIKNNAEVADKTKSLLDSNNTGSIIWSNEIEL